MAPRQSRPEKGGGVGHWPCCKVASGESWQAWYAGGAFWIRSHGERPTRPCVCELTDAALPCAPCAAGVLTELIGYVPLYRALDCKPCVVIVHETQWDRLLGMTKHTPIWVGRGEEQSDGIYVARDHGGKVYQTTLEARKRVPDIFPSLLRMWKNAELCAWYAALPTGQAIDHAATASDEPAESDNPLSLNGAGKGGGEAPRARASESERNGTPAPDVPTFEAAGEQVLRNLRARFGLTKPGTNGDGKH